MRLRSRNVPSAFETASPAEEPREAAAPKAAPRKRQRKPKKQGGAAKRRPGAGKLEDSNAPKIPIEIIAYNVVPFVGTLKTMISLSSTCQELRELLVHRTTATRHWKAAVRRSKKASKLNQSDAASHFAVSAPVLKADCPFEQLRTYSRSHRGYYTTHLFKFSDLFETVAMQRRHKNSKAKGGTVGALIEARQKRLQRAASLQRSRNAKHFKARHAGVLEATLEGGKRGKESIERLFGRDLMLLLNQQRLAAQRELKVAVEEENVAEVSAIEGRVVCVKHALSLISLVEQAAALEARWVGDDKPRLKSDIEAACEEVESVEEISSLADEYSTAFKTAQSTFNARVLSEKANALAPLQELLAGRRAEDRALTRSQRVRKARDALSAAGLNSDPPRSELLEAYFDWRLGGAGLCVEEVVAVRRVVDQAYANRMLRHLPSDLSSQLESSVRSHALGYFNKNKMAWTPTIPELEAALETAGSSAFDDIQSEAYNEDRYSDYEDRHYGWRGRYW